MSYTMTMDMPKKASEYIERRGPRFRDELNAIVLTFIMVRMRGEAGDALKFSTERDDGAPRRSGLDFFNSLRASAPLLDDDEMHLFDRVKDYGRNIELA